MTPTHHIVAGASKRGYSTWHVAAVDPRVIAIVPIVMDALNFAQNAQHHYRSLGGACLTLIWISQLKGGWSFVLKDYWHMNLTTLFNEPEMQVRRLLLSACYKSRSYYTIDTDIKGNPKAGFTWSLILQHSDGLWYCWSICLQGEDYFAQG